MKRKIFSILFALVLVCSFSLVAAVPVMAATLTVDTSVPNTPPNYHTIQAAIDAAGTGDTINVAAGTYTENVTIGTADVTLQAVTKHEAVIEGTVTIEADGVTLDGFSIKNFSRIPTPEWSGVYMPSGTGITVANNLIDGAGIDPVTYLTVGIHTLYGGTAEATLEGNIVRNVRLGIYNQGAVLLISKNTIENTAHCAIGVDTSLGTTITENTISNSASLGIEVFGENVVANYNNITGSGDFGVKSFGPQVDATLNWWGDASGPSGVGPGTGDAVSDYVDYDPWVTGLTYTGSTVFPVSEPVVLEATFNISSPGDKSGVEVYFYVNGSPVDSSFTDANGVATLDIGPKDVGVYTVRAVALDPCLEAEALVVVYDPSAGFVTGGGWINSPPGAYSYTSPCQVYLSGNTAEMSWEGDTTGLMYRDTMAICDPNSSFVMFTGTVDVTGLQDNGAVMIGLVDKKCVDEGDTGYMGGAYTYFGRRGQNLVIGPTDGNLGGEIVQTFITLTDYFAVPEPPPVSFETTIYAGSISVVSPGGTDDDYGFVKTLNNTDAYAWNEFEFGAYVGIDSWPPTNAVLYDVNIEGCQCQLTGKANFGFVSKYKKGANVPEGNTEFRFQAADLNFHSSSYDWLVITGGQKAMFKGTGTINGAGNYGFMLSAIDGDPDMFRIKIWDKATDCVIYDNGCSGPDGTEIGGGQIIVHTSKK